MEGSLTDGLRAGSRLACARGITLVENEGPGYLDFLKEIYPNSESAYVIGVTGPPGVGKSTLCDKLAGLFSEKGHNVGILAVDPSSPFTKGAILGDRVRMNRLSADPRVFIRSMGTRGSLGGLSKAAAGAVTVLAAYGCEYILIETVGVGQSEIDIVKTADTTLMVLAPGLGDDIQAIKAGVMEIADVFAVNKADRDGAHKTLRETLAMLDYRTDWAFKPTVTMTVAETGDGVESLMDAIIAHKAFLHDSGAFEVRRRNRKTALVKDIIKHKLELRVQEFIEKADPSDSIQDPYTLAESLLGAINLESI